MSLLISNHTFSRLQNPADYAIRMIDQVQVKGKSERVTVYEVFDTDLPQIREGKLATAKIFAEALSLYNQQNGRGAMQLFQEVLKINPGDKVAQFYLQCSQQQTPQPPTYTSLINPFQATQYEGFPVSG